MSLQLHERTMPVAKARNELDGYVIDWAKRNELTLTEIVQALLTIAVDYTKYQLREERYPELQPEDDSDIEGAAI